MKLLQQFENYMRAERLCVESTIKFKGCPSGGIYDIFIKYPHCDHEEQL